MAHYRVYFIGSDGHITAGQFIEGANDREATEKARQLVDGQDVELWQRARLIGRFPHDRPWAEHDLPWAERE